MIRAKETVTVGKKKISPRITEDRFSEIDLLLKRIVAGNFILEGFAAAASTHVCRMYCIDVA